MRHLKRGRKLNRTSSHRRAMIRNLVTSLFEHGRVITSPAKAKEARPVAERLITMAKRGTLAERRRAIAALNDPQTVAQLFDTIAPRYAKRPGGYCRILHLDRQRVGDNGDLCLFELVEEELKQKKGRAKRKRAKVEKDAAAEKAQEEEVAEESAEAGEAEEAAEESTEEAEEKEEASE